MRILRLVDDDFVLEFHPYITVVESLDEARRDAVTEAFQQAALGRASALRGLLEVHGVVLDLDDRSLALLELGNDEVETCVWASDLPGGVSGGVGRQVRSAERRLEALEQPQRDRTAALAAAEEELARAQHAEREARAVFASLDAAPGPEPQVDGEERTVDDEDEEREALEARREAIATERATLDGQLDPDAGQALDEAVATLEAAEEALERAHATLTELAVVDGATGGDTVLDDPDEEADAALSSEELVDRLSDLRAALALLRLDDPTPIRDALDEVRSGHDTGEMVPSTEALSLADRIDSLGREIGTPDDDIDAPTSVELEAAADDVERARATLAEVERQASDSGTGADVDALEVAHAEVEKARDAVGSRLGRARAQRRLDAAVAAENELLDQLGLSSYTEFLTLGGAASRPGAGSHEIDLARRSLERAEHVAADLEGRVDAALGKAEAVAARGALLDEARTLLGDDDLADDQVPTALMDHRVPASASAQVDVLLDLLDEIGLPVRDLGLDAEDVEQMAAEWLAERQHAESRMLRRIDDLEHHRESRYETQPKAPTEETAEVDEDDESGARADAEAEVQRAQGDVAEADRMVRASKDRVIAHERASARAASLAEDDASIVEELQALESARVSANEVAAASAAVEAREQAERTDDAREAATAGVAEATTAVDAARSAVTSAQAALDAGQIDYNAAVEELAAIRRSLEDLDDVPPPVDEVEWYLLARLAGQRQQSFVGSLPLVLIETLDAVDDEGLEHLLDRLERMAGAVQIVHLTDDPRVAAWANALPDERAAVVHPLGRVS